MGSCRALSKGMKQPGWVPPFCDVPPGLHREFSTTERQAPLFLGRPAGDAQARAAREGVDQVRVLSLDGDVVRMHRDHRPDRLNLLVLGGVVVRAYF